jgi:hypothetical protein
VFYQKIGGMRVKSSFRKEIVSLAFMVLNSEIHPTHGAYSEILSHHILFMFSRDQSSEQGDFQSYFRYL